MESIETIVLIFLILYSYFYTCQLFYNSIKPSHNKIVFIPKDVYKIILTMKFEMEMADEIKSHVNNLHEFYDIIKNSWLHYSFPSYNIFCFFTKEIYKFLPKLKQIKNISLYQKDNKPWYYIRSHTSGYQVKMIRFLKEHPYKEIDPLLKGFFLYQQEFELGDSTRYKSITFDM